MMLKGIGGIATSIMVLVRFIIDIKKERFKMTKTDIFTIVGLSIVIVIQVIEFIFTVIIKIGSHAFEGCDSLTKVTIPDSVTNIGNYAFLGCSKRRKGI